MGLFGRLPVPPEKEYLRDELSKVDECWVTPRFDSLPHVVHILAARDREREVQVLREQSDVVEEAVDEIVQLYHTGFNKAIQNYSQILHLFSESGDTISGLKIDLAEAKKRLSARNKQLHQLWYRSVTLRHIISLLDQIEGVAKVPARIKKLISEKQFYAAVQLLGQSSLMLEREGLQLVGALQEVRSELNKLRGAIFFSILEELQEHLYNKGEFSSRAFIDDRGDEVPTAGTVGLGGSSNIVIKGSTSAVHNEAATDGQMSGDDSQKDVKVASCQILTWLSCSTPDEFVETMKKSDDPLHVKYLRTLVQCVSMLGKVASAGAMICQSLRPTVHEIITSKIKAHAEFVNSSRSAKSQAAQSSITGIRSVKKQLKSYQLSNKQKRQNEISPPGTLLVVSPVSHMMAPKGKAQIVAKQLLDFVLDIIVRIFENHVVVGELLAAKSSRKANMKGPSSLPTGVTDSELAMVAGGYSVGFCLTVLQSECQQLICEILRATPEAASADAALQTARLATAPSVKNRDGSDNELTFVFCFTDATMSKEGAGVLDKKGNVLQEGYGSAAVLPEQGIYLAAAVYRPVLQFTQKVSSLLQEKYSQLGNDGLLAFVEKFVKEHLLPTMFVEYRKGVQHAMSSPSSFRPRAQTATTYIPLIEMGRPVLPGLLAIDFLMKEVLGWAQAMPKFANDLMNFMQSFLERTYEKCRTSYMEAVLQKQSYMLIGRNDIERLMRMHPASSCLPNPHGLSNMDNNTSDAEVVEVELQLNDLLLLLRPIRQENLIRDDTRLIMLASLSDSLEYVADSIERLGLTALKASNDVEESVKRHNSRIGSLSSRATESFADGYRKLAVDCLKVLHVEMQLETIFHLQEMSDREYLEDRDAEEPDDFIISLTAKITRRDEAMTPFVSGVKRNYIFGGICGIAADTSTKALADMKSINLFGVQQICRNTIALEQVLAALPSIGSESVQLRLDRVRTYYELLNMPFEALLAFITENPHSFAATEYENLLNIQVPGREIPADALSRVSEILSQ